MRFVWHDIECGAYAEDIPLWRTLAAEYGDPVLDIGAGTGRVSLDLARRGHAVTALDNDPDLVAELAQRGEGLPLETVAADARGFELERRFRLCIVPMQTIQLLGGADGRASFLRRAARHLLPGGALAVAISAALDTYEVDAGAPAPLPDVREYDGIVYSSQPVAVREDGDGYVLARRRDTVTVAGRHTSESNEVRLDRLSASECEREARGHGFAPHGRIEVPPTRDYAGSVVVVLRA